MYTHCESGVVDDAGLLYRGPVWSDAVNIPYRKVKLEKIQPKALHRSATEVFVERILSKWFTTEE